MQVGSYIYQYQELHTYILILKVQLDYRKAENIDIKSVTVIHLNDIKPGNQY